MKTIILLITIFLLISCKSQQITCGSFVGSEKLPQRVFSRHVELELNQDGTCSLIKLFDLSKFECRGEWTVINGNLITIQCNKNPVLNDSEKGLLSGSFIEGNLEIKILSKNKLKLGNVVLKRKE